MQLILNSMEKSRFFAEGEPLKLSESFLVAGRRCDIFGQNLLRIYFKMRADFLLIRNQPISAPSRLVRPLKNSLA